MKIKEEKELLRVLVLDKENSKLLKSIVNEYGINYLTKEGRTILNYSIILKSVFLSTYLLSNKDCNINYQEEESGFSALHFAVQEKFIPAIDLLLGRDDLQIDIQDNWGNTPLWRAIMNSVDEDIIIKLLEKGADINKKNNSDVAPIDLLDDSMSKVIKWIEENKK